MSGYLWRYDLVGFILLHSFSADLALIYCR